HAVAEHVNHDVLIEDVAIIECETGNADTRLRVVAIHVEDGGLDGPGHIGGIRRASRIRRSRREADLIIDDDVDRPAGLVTAHQSRLERLYYHALVCGGSLSVYMNMNRVMKIVSARGLPCLFQ